ncbi:MAG TPA: hypothetical protein VFW68_03595 [Rhodocyclaceae bacterium]|nr:hypothetical protein [Rhodocyclaceae bacterium]
MNKVIQELQRLYFLPDQQCHSRHRDKEGPLTAELMTKSLQGETALALKLVSADNTLRMLVIAFAKGSDWSRLASFYQHLQNDLGLPPLAVSISAQGGFQLWLSLAECIPLAQAEAFLRGLQRKYADDLPPANTRLLPSVSDALADMAPAFHQATDRWSAFIDPSLGSMFIDEPGLEIAPNMEGQADILSGFESIKTEDFQRALNLLQAAVESNTASMEGTSSAPSEATNLPGADIGTHHGDPKSFLLAVMNSPSATLDQRIKAATALLPHFESTKP